MGNILKSFYLYYINDPIQTSYLACIAFFIRFHHVKACIDVYNGKKVLLNVINELGFWTGIIGAFGLSIVANFQVLNKNEKHM